MQFYADLHIHSKYSRATSKNCNLEELALWAQKKGLSVISTGDFTHPAWFEEIKEKLVPAGNGVFRLRADIERHILKPQNPVYFLLSVEISTIYKKGDKTRKVHHVVFSPNMESAQNFREKLSAIGNIKSDGRPILGLDSRNLLETVLESGEGSYIIPAHIWTPWFSVLGSKSGFNSIEECYEDLSSHIFAVETGLSSDPEMNWHVSSLDKFRLVSNSDAHSPSKLAREATIFDTVPDYFSIMNALKTGKGYVGTVEFFPEEGKYHDDGHRKCNICLTPDETQKLNGICPICGKPLTIGVANRVYELSDRKGKIIPPSTAGKVVSLVPLAEILSEIMQVGASSKSVTLEYENLINKLGSELSILTTVPVEDIEKVHSPILAEGIKRLRKGDVIRQPGYDGEYGVIKLFNENEIVKKNSLNLKLDIEIPEDKIEENNKNKLKTSVTKEYSININNNCRQKAENTKSATPDEYQLSAIQSSSKNIVITAGPGSGKTTVLTRRIVYLIKEKQIPANNCLAITFTKKAAHEMNDRISLLLDTREHSVNIHTFHSLSFSVLKENFAAAGLPEEFHIITEEEKSLYNDSDIPDNMLYFDDLIALTLKLFNNKHEILKKYQNKFKYIFIDEYQDIDEQQYELINLLATDETYLSVIGDPNQAIYGFRGGDAKFFNSFSKDFKDVEMINLKNNYRSAKDIVNASNQMIKSGNLISKCRTSNNKITIHTAPTEKAEAEFIVSTIENLIGGNSLFSIDSDRSDGQKEEFSFGDFAILYRTSLQLKPLEEALTRSGMPFIKLSDDLLCTKKIIRKLLKSLNNNSSVSEQLKNLRHEFKEGIDAFVWEYLEKLALKHNKRNEFIHEVSLSKESDTIDSRADRISLMTLHSSKGLEFNCVFIAGLENGLLPLYKAQTEKEIDEEKRLLYVGITRAKQRLFLTHSLKRRIFGKIEDRKISPFLQDIEKDLIKLSNFQKQYKQIQKNNSTQLSLF